MLQDRSATTPLAFAALNLHRRLHQILYEGYAQVRPRPLLDRPSRSDSM
jgi:hypothetical protein